MNQPWPYCSMPSLSLWELEAKFLKEQIYEDRLKCSMTWALMSVPANEWWWRIRKYWLKHQKPLIEHEGHQQLRITHEPPIGDGNDFRRT